MTIWQKKIEALLQKRLFCKIFAFTSEAHIKKIDTSKIKYHSKLVFLQDFRFYQ